MAKKEFSAIQVMALMERLEKKIDVIAEGHGGLLARLVRIEEKVGIIQEQVANNSVSITHMKSELKIIIEKLGQIPKKEELDQLEKRVTKLEHHIGLV